MSGTCFQRACLEQIQHSGVQGIDGKPCKGMLQDTKRVVGSPPPLLPIDVSALTARRQPLIKCVNDIPGTLDWPDSQNENATVSYVLFMVAYGDGCHFVADVNIPADYWGDDAGMPGWYRYDSKYATPKRGLQSRKGVPRSPPGKRVDWVWYARVG